MADMSAAHKNFVTNTGQQCRLLLNMAGTVEQLNTLWAGSPNYDGLITQAEIDTVPAFVGGGLTVQDLADAEFALAQILTTINNALVAFTVVSSIL